MVRRWLDFDSLQTRLTLGVMLAVLAVFGGTVSWTLWRTDRMLSVQHQTTLQSIIQRLPDEVLAQNSEELAVQLQTTINQLSSPTVWIWIKTNDHTLLAQSPALSTILNTQELLTLPPPASPAQTFYLHDRVIMLCTYPLRQQGKTIGQFYVAEDVTQDYVILKRLTQSLQFVSFGAIVILILFVTWFIRRSLRPLNQLKQVTNGQSTLLWLESGEVPTEIRELVHTYTLLHDRLSKSSLKQQQFTHSISHELRTPLSLVYGYLQSTLKRCPNLTESQQEALSIAVLETENIIQLLQALLDKARLEESLTELHLEPVQVKAIVEKVVSTVQHFDHRTVHLECSEPCVAIADAEALNQVLAQLLNNAVRYSEATQPILVRLFPSNDQVLIEVSDRGCGIDPSQHSLIFEPLYRVEPSRSRNTGGIGLGLSIARSLVEGMGGTIAITSELGKGSTFTVTLRRITP